MKRSDRHKPENQNKKTTLNNENEQNKAREEGKLSKYVSKDQIDKGKTFFKGKLSAYNSQLKEENKILKEKFTNFRTGNARQERDPNQKRPVIPIIITGILLLPITILLAFLLITNFLPDETDMNRIASDDATDETEETDVAEDGTEDDDTDIAVVDDDDALDDAAEDIDTSEDIPEQETEILTIADYSSTERQQLQRAAQAAVNEKNAEIALIREQQAAERARQQAAEEQARQEEQTEDTAEETDETDTETEETNEGESDSPLAGNAVHVVTAEDNLYRIAIQYYGDGSAANVQRIRDANGISGDSLTVGQELIIP